jgi:hypothetical protein
MKLIHYADVQVKNRERNLYRSYNNTLQQIEKHIITEKAEIVLLAGDLWEYCNPNDSERKLIYNHLSRILNIPTVKELVVFNGNHDLEKSKKETETSIGNNPLNVFVDLLKELHPLLYDKVIYANESKIYQSKISNKIEYIGFVLEDDMNFNDYENIDKNKLQICLFHGMISNYVDSVKLPIRKDIYESLKSLEIFPQGSLIPSGDIHINLRFDGLNDQLFIYPGSTTSHTHTEGSYYKISEKIETQKIADDKSIKCYEIPNILLKVTIPDLIISDLPLKHTTQYFTIELDNKVPIETISKNLTEFCENIFDKEYKSQTFIKVKSSNVLVKHEQTLFNIIYESFANTKSNAPNIHFEYDKLIQTSVTSNNKVIQEILAEKDAENLENSENITSETFTDEIPNIDSLILSDIHLYKLFQSVLDIALKSIDDSEITNQELSFDIRNLFEKELTNLKGNSKRYNLEFLSIETDGFMALMKNNIPLNIPGITRILGTNGIGKTTLYHMIRWCITGEVFTEMSKASALKNNLIVFNKKNFNSDIVDVKLNMNVNDLPVKLTRTIERKWKNNTTDEQKVSLKWKNFVSTVDRKFKIEITTPSGEVKSFIGDKAESSILTWFGDTLNNILFMNQTKLENLLLSPSAKLNEMVLNFVGVDYLDKLENNLENVKTELTTVGKPIKSKDDLIMDITDAKIQVKKITTELLESDKTIETLKSELEELKLQKEKSNNELLNLGNIPDIIEGKQNEALELKQFLDKFTEKIKHGKVEFKEVQPVLNQNEISILDQYNETLSLGLCDSNQIIEEKTKLNKELIDVELKTLIDKKEEKLYNRIEFEIATIEQYGIVIKNNFDEITKYLDETIYRLELKKTEFGIEILNWKSKLDFNNITIKKNNKTIESGICDKCLRPFEEDFDKHKKLLIQENSNFLLENIDLQEKINEKTLILDKTKKLITEYNNYRDMSIANNSKICDYTNLNVALKVQFSKILGGNTLISELNQKIIDLRKELSNWLLTPQIQNGKYAYVQSLIKDNEELNEIIWKHNINAELITLNTTNIESYREDIVQNNEKIKSITTSHNKALENYQLLLNDNIEQNKSIDIENQKIDEYNNSKLIKDSEYSKLLVVISQLETIDLPNYNNKTLINEENKKLFDEKQIELTDLNNNINLMKLNLQKNELKLELTQKEYDKYLLYQKNNLIWKIYSKLVKTSFKEIIFEYYRTFLNSTLNNLLIDLSFKLYWNEDSELYHVDMKNGITTYQMVSQSSGMETCFLALALVYTIHILNVKNSISHIFIDEISGTLNSGEELSYEATNYREMLVMVLNKFKDKSVFIIDHSIRNMFETITYEVSSTPQGSIYMKI